jgi:hypothetical protein
MLHTKEFTKITHFSNAYYHTSIQDPILSCATFTLTL